MENNLEKKRSELIEILDYYRAWLEGRAKKCPRERYLKSLSTFPETEQEVIAVIGVNHIDTIKEKNIIFDPQENDALKDMIDIIGDQIGLWPLLAPNDNEYGPKHTDDIELVKSSFKKWTKTNAQAYLYNFAEDYDDSIFCSVNACVETLVEHTPHNWFSKWRRNEEYYVRGNTETISLMHKVTARLGWIGAEIVSADPDKFPECIFFFSDTFNETYLRIIENFQEHDISCKRVIKNKGVLSMEILWE